MICITKLESDGSRIMSPVNCLMRQPARQISGGGSSVVAASRVKLPRRKSTPYSRAYIINKR